MAFSIWHILKAVLLFINAAAILNEERFLARIGWGSQSAELGFGQQNSVKSKVVSLIGSVQTLLRIPLIGLNICWIIMELLVG